MSTLSSLRSNRLCFVFHGKFRSSCSLVLLFLQTIHITFPSLHMLTILLLLLLLQQQQQQQQQQHVTPWGSWGSCPVSCSSPPPPEPVQLCHCTSLHSAGGTPATVDPARPHTGPGIDALQLFPNPALDFDPLPFFNAPSLRTLLTWWSFVAV